MKIFEWSEKYVEPREIQVPNLVGTEREIIFPKNVSDRLVPLGQHIAFRKTSEPIFIDAVMKIFYQDDQEVGNTTYYTMKKLRFPVRSSPEEILQVVVVDQDEGKL